MIVPSQPNSANLGNSSKVEIPPDAINLIPWASANFSTPLEVTLTSQL